MRKLLLRDLRNKQNKYKLELSSLMYDYRELQRYFKESNSTQEAEDLFYNRKFMESGYDSEGKFSMRYNSLLSEIKSNRESRYEVSQSLKSIKNEIKNINKDII